MVKTIIKEIGISLLLLIAIALILGILFYDYIPNNKTVPIKIQAYEMPDDVEQELEEALPEAEQQNIVKTFYIDDTDLNSYEATNDYDKGKPNPFAEYKEIEPENTDTDSENTNANGNNASNNSTNNNTQNTSNEDEVYITTPGKNS